jgi:hypothetical protein
MIILVCCRPKGPSTSIILGTSTLVIIFFCFSGGSKIVKVTSVGNETGASPIRDAHRGVVENVRAFAVEKAGIRKSGRPRADMRSILDDWTQYDPITAM